MAGAQGVATLTFDADAQAARYRSEVVVSDSAPNPNLNNTTWAQRALPTTQNWRAIAWNGSVFCAIVNSTTVAVTSPDGVTWTQRTMPSAASWWAIASNGSIFCVVASSGAAAATSPDGITWTPQTMPASAQYQSVAWNGSVFCAVAQNGTIAATSPDGVTWTSQTLPQNTGWNSIAWNGTVFCAIAGAGSARNIAATSPDGVTWTLRTLSAILLWNQIAWNGSVFCAVAQNSNVVTTSPDGITWTSRVLPTGLTDWKAIECRGDLFCTVNALSQAASSRDGISWTLAPTPSNGAVALASNGSIFCALTTSAAMTSPDGVSGDGPLLANTRTVSTVNTEVTPALPSPGSNIATTTVTGQTGLLSTHAIDAWIQGDSTADFSAYEHSTLPVRVAVTNVVDGVGFDITAYSDMRLQGDFKVRWVWTDNANTGTATVNFGTGFGSDAATVTVTGIVTLTAGSYVQAWVQGSDSTADNSAYEHTYIPIRLRVTDKIAGTGFTIRAQSDFRLTGEFKVRYAFTT